MNAVKIIPTQNTGPGQRSQRQRRDPGTQRQPDADEANEVPDALPEPAGIAEVLRATPQGAAGPLDQKAERRD